MDDIEKIKKILDFNKRIINFVDNKIKPAITTAEIGFKNVAIFIFAKSTKTIRAINLLCDNGFGEDAAILARNLLENLIVLTYIKKDDTEQRTKLFVGHWAVDYKNYIKNHYLDLDKKYSEIPEKVKQGINEIYEATIKNKKEECEKLKKGEKNINSNSWSCLSLAKMARKTGLKEIYYDKVYWLISQFSHPHAGAAKGYVMEDGRGGFIINDMPSSFFISETLEISSHIYLKLLDCFNEALKLNYGQQIETYFSEYIDLIKNYNK